MKTKKTVVVNILLCLILIILFVYTKQRADLIQTKEQYTANMHRYYISIITPILSCESCEEVEAVYNKDEMKQTIFEFNQYWAEYQDFAEKHDIFYTNDYDVKKINTAVTEFQDFRAILREYTTDEQLWAQALESSKESYQRDINHWEKNLDIVEDRLETPWRSYFFNAWSISLDSPT